MSEVLSNDNDLVSKTNFENIKCITDISNATLID